MFIFFCLFFFVYFFVNFVLFILFCLFFSTKLPECADDGSARDSTFIFLEIFEKIVLTSSNTGCIIPCTLTTYKTDLKYSHGNSWVIYDDSQNVSKSFRLYFYYYTMTVEEKLETLIFDLGGLFAAAGGHLGLCLGFSCLSVLVEAISWISYTLKQLKVNLVKN